MTGAAFILAINIFVAGLLAASFLAIAAYDRRRESARWLALSYAIGATNFLLEIAIGTLGTSTLLVLVSFGALLAALTVFNVGVARKYGVDVPWLPMGVVFGVSMVACYLIQDMSRQSVARMLIYQAPYFVMQMIAAVIVLKARQRTSIDNLLGGLLAASALQFLSKPFLFLAVGGTGDNPNLYIDTVYAMLSQSMGTIFALAIALMLLVMLLRDVLADANARSETDTLSGLLNRGGFELHAADALREAARRNTPVSLVISDLDHFKSINDNYGHASGDRVIVAFAGFLRRTIAPHHIAARIGGEEFAILLPGTNVVSARLFAEGIRSEFRSIRVEGMPGKQFTASFGVAEMAPGERIDELMARADKALYIAKNSGRDCVKIAPMPARRNGSGQNTAISLS
jgi:diguanylate cyclase (GGDEF)-like protein